MTAAPMPDPEMPTVPGWPIPPKEGYTAEDLDHIPELPAHTELIDGSLIFVSPQRNFHMLAVDLLVMVLRRLVPDHLRVRREMTVTLGKRQRPEPDVLVLHVDGIEGPEQCDFKPEHVVLAIEVMSPDSEERDRKRKPLLYAEAGIPHFWRVENNAGYPTVYVYELDPASKAYALAGIHHDRLKLTLPFEIDIDLKAIDEL